MNQRFNDSVGQCTNKETNHWINESCNQRIIEWRHWANFIFQKCSDPLSFLRFLCETELSLQSRAHFADLIFQNCSACHSPVHILPTSSSKSTLRPSVLNIVKWQLSSRYSPVYVLPTSSSKSAPSPSVFLTFWRKSSSRYSPATRRFLSTTSQIDAHNPKQRPYFILLWRPWKPLYPNAPGRVFTREFACSRAVTLIPTPWWWLVDMMRH